MRPWDPAPTAGKTTLNSGPPAAPEDAHALGEDRSSTPHANVLSSPAASAGPHSAAGPACLGTGPSMEEKGRVNMAHLSCS